MYLLRWHRQTILLKFGFYGTLGGDNHSAVGLQRLHQPLFLLEGKALLTYIVMSFQRHKAHDEEALAIGQSGMLQHVGVGGEAVGMQVGQLMSAGIIDGLLGLAVDTVGGEDHIGKRMTVFDNQGLCRIVVVIEH